jgi:hypothetical protein
MMSVEEYRDLANGELYELESDEAAQMLEIQIEVSDEIALEEGK